MRRRSRLLAVVLAGLALLLVAWLRLGRPDGVDAPRGEADAADATDGAGDVDLHEAARAESLRLRGMPGIALAARGVGAVAGEARLFVPDAGERPLPGVEVELAGVDAAGREVIVAATSDERGAFTLAPVPAMSGYVLRARHPPHRDALSRGISVRDGVVTPVGPFVFGAPTTLVGSVVEASGRPVGAALVAVERGRPPGSSMDLGRVLRDLAEGPPPLAEGRTEADGTFRIDGLPPGRYLLRVTSPGRATAWFDGAVVTAQGDAGSVRLVLDPGAGFEGRVLDEDGRGIVGARVVAVSVRAGPRDFVDHAEVLSGADGRFRLDTLVDGTLYFVEAHRDGYAASGRIVSARGVSPLDLVLPLGGVVRGRVFASRTGGGVAGAEVLVVTGLGGAGTAPLATVADADGNFRFEHVVPGPVVLVEARAPGHAPGGFGYDAKAPRIVRASETTTIDVALDDGGRVLGRVRSEDGAPVAYASVVAGREGDRFGGETATLTDVRGEYRIPGLKPGRYVLSVAAPGYAPPVEDADVRVDVVNGADVSRDVTLSRGGAVTGRVTAPDGARVVGARVVLLPADEGRFASRVRDLVAVSDGAGAYRVAGAPPGIDLVVEATHDAFVPTRSAPFRATSGGERAVDLVLRDGARVLGRVDDAAGRPVAGARVRFASVPASDVGRYGDSFAADGVLLARVFVGRTDGSFVVEGARAGPLLLRVDADGYAPWYRRDLVVPDVGDLAGVRVTLHGASTIRGRVTSAGTGAALAGAWVGARTRDVEGAPPDPGGVRTVVSAEAGATGAYVLEGVPPGPYDVVVWFAVGHQVGGRDPASKRDAVTAGASGVDFRLEPLPAPDGTPR